LVSIHRVRRFNECDVVWQKVGYVNMAVVELKDALANLQTFISKLKKQSEDKPEIEPVTFIEKLFRGETVFSIEGLGGVVLAEAEGIEYRKIVSKVHLAVARRFGQSKNPDELHVSKATVESAIQSAILRALDPMKGATDPFEERLSGCLADLKETLLKEPEPWLVHMEVRGLAPESLPHRFGEIEFYVANGAEETEKQSGESDRQAARTSEVTGTPATKTEFTDLFVPTKGAIYAKVPIEATDLEAAKVLAERKLRLTVDALNYFGDFFDVLDSRVVLPGDATMSVVKTFICSRTNPTRKYPSAGWTRPSFVRFSFAAVAKSSAKASGFERVSSILANPSLSSLDEKILSSLQWAGRASIEGRKEQAFLLFCISLEALLLNRKSTGEITQTFALRGAHLLTSDATHRKEVFKDLKSLYGVRSAIVHSGHTQVTEADLSKIRWLTKAAVWIMLVREPFSTLKTEEELEDWFETQLLAGVESVPAAQDG
jgi:hypothetical protein